METIKVNNSSEKEAGKIRFVCISDTHGKTDFQIPDGDVLIHSGDIARRSTLVEYEKTIDWLASLPHKIKLITAGNHDIILDEQYSYTDERQELLSMMEENNLIYLQHELYQLSEQFGSFRIFVSPYSPMHLGGAFMLSDMSKIWKDIPAADILVTHTPPYGHGDLIIRGRHVGCKELKNQMDEVIQPKVSVFGHIHEAHGHSFDEEGRLYVNACLCDHRYRGNQQPITFDL